jgi:MFS family permease
MVVALALVGLTSMLMLVFTSAVELFALRFIAGVASGMFGPAARGELVDATDPGTRGQAFGYFSAFMNGGFVLGPAIGAFGTSIFGGYTFPFVFMGLLGFASAAFLWRNLKPATHVADLLHRAGETESALAKTGMHSTAAERVYDPDPEPKPMKQAPLRDVFNRTLLAAVIIGFGLQLTMGIYDVVWPLFMIDLGADVAWIGLTFMLLGLPSMILAPVFGRFVDRWGSIPFVVAGSLVMVGAGVAYALSTEPVMPAVAATIESAFAAMLGTALFAMVASGSPQGRTALAQGIYGSVGTTAIIVSTMLSGALYELERTLPFWFFAGTVAVTFALGMIVYTGFLGRWRRGSETEAEEAAASA